MQEYQNHDLYKSLLKTFADNAAKIVALRQSEDMSIEEASELLSVIDETSPALRNLARELNTKYGAEIPVEKYENAFPSEIEKLIVQINNEFSSNPNLRNVKPCFSSHSKNLSDRLDALFEYTQTGEDDVFEAKSMYWLYHSVNLAEYVFDEDFSNEDEKLWNDIEHSDIAELIIRKIQYIDMDNEEDDEQDIVNDCIYRTCIDIISSSDKQEIKALLYDKLKEEKVVLDDSLSDFAEVEDGIQRLINKHQPSYDLIESKYEIISTFFDKIWEYDDRSIEKMINQANEKKHTQQQQNPSIQNSDDYKELSIEMKKYQENKIDDDFLKQYFSGRFKDWAWGLTNFADQYYGDILKIGYEFNRILSDEEKKSAVSEILNTARDIVLVSKISPEICFVEKDSQKPQRVVFRNMSSRLEYIEKLIEHPEQMQSDDFQNLSVIFKNYAQEYWDQQDLMQRSQAENEALSYHEEDEFIEKLLSKPDCKDKYIYSYYMQRMLDFESKFWANEMKKHIKEFQGRASSIYQREYYHLTSYIEEGKEIFPQTKKVDILEQVDDLVSAVTTIPLHTHGKEVPEDQWTDLLDYSVENVEIDDVGKSFIKSAASGFRRSIIKKFNEHELTDQQNKILSSYAKDYENANGNWFAINDNMEKLGTSLQYQEMYYQIYQKYMKDMETSNLSSDKFAQMLQNKKSQQR